jgi:glyoxylase-like metal-dependent hydrolase (beta-lactamase superfamily II)
MRTGHVEWALVSDGTFRLDGGAMFGVVPKPLWAAKSPPDERNRIRLGLHPLLIRAGGRTILVDCGIGRKESGRFPEIYGVGDETDLVRSLAELGVAASDVDTVVYTHLHFDHAGGGTRRDADGRIVPAFPRARHLVQRDELDDAERPTDRSRASYLPDNWRPVRDAGLLDVVEGETELAPGVRTFLMKGHVRCLTGVVIEAAGEKVVYPSDNVPTSAHVPVPWVMAYDLYPLDTVAFKEQFLPQAIDEEWTVVFGHDPEVGAVKIRRDGGKLALEEVLHAPDCGARSERSRR